MQVRRCLYVLVAFAPLLFSAALFAQFAPPTAEELSMTSEPKAPGAAAIYLYREETVDDNLHYHSFFARIKVLTEKGKELATQSVPYAKGYNTITDVKARTIHSDGTVIPLDVKPSDLVEAKVGTLQVNKVVFTLPSVEVGSILEFKWALRYDDNQVSSPDWDLAQPYFVRKAHYSFKPYKNLADITVNDEPAGKLLYSGMLPPGVEVKEEPLSSLCTLDLTDLAPIPEEEYMPPIGSYIAQVQFYYTRFSNKDEFWQNAGNKWSKQMDHFASESKGIKDAVAGIVAPGDSDEVKAHKLYDAIMKLDNTDYTRRKSKEELKRAGLRQTKTAEDVWKQKSGSSDEIALLYLAMARSVGIKAYAIVVCDRDREIFNPYYMSMRQLDDVLVIVRIGDKEQFLDPGKKFATFGELDWRHSLVGGIRQQDKGTAIWTTPSNNYKAAVTYRFADVTIDKEGNLKGSARVSMVGPSALHWRQMALQNDEDEVKKNFNESLKGMVPDGVTAELDHFLGLETYNSQLMAMVKLSGNIGASTGKRAFLPGVFFESRAKHPFVTMEKRTTIVDMHYAEVVQDDVTYHVPDNFVVESAPAETSVPWAGHAGFTLKSQTDKNAIHISRSFLRGFAMVQPAEYAALRDFYQKIQTADQQQIVLKAAPADAAKDASAKAAPGN